MIHANPFSAQARFSEHDDALAGSDHFLHVMKVEPSAHQRFAQCIGLRFFQRRFKDFFPSAKTSQRRLYNLAAKTNRNIAFFARKTRELGAIFVAPWKMREQILPCLAAETPQGEQTRAGDPAEFFK